MLLEPFTLLAEVPASLPLPQIFFLDVVAGIAVCVVVVHITLSGMPRCFLCHCPISLSVFRQFLACHFLSIGQAKNCITKQIQNKGLRGGRDG